MERILATFFFVFLCIVTALTDAAGNDSVSAYDTAVIHLIRQDYSTAQKLLATHLRTDPDDMNALYLSFAIEQTRILDYESYMVEHREFQNMADSLKGIFESRLNKLHGFDSTVCLFYLANVYGGTGVMQAKTGNWFDGVKNAITSVSMLKQVKKRDSTFYAADLGVGIFNYYLSTSLKWLPFTENKEKEGIDAIELALNADFPYNYAAKNSLCWILIDRKDFRRADSIAQSVLDEYPDNTIFLRIKMLIKLWTGRYEDALRYGTKLVEVTEKRQPGNWSDLVAGYMVLVQSYEELGKSDHACAAAENLLRRKIPSAYLQIPHIKKHLKYVRGVRQNCRKER